MRRLRRWWYQLQDKMDRDTIQALLHAIEETERERDRLYSRLHEVNLEVAARREKRRPL